MDSRAIGVFDSGLGGLTAVKELVKVLPNEDIVYFGDTGRVPYGSRSRETIIKYAKEDVKFLIGHDIKLVIAACGTVSSVALSILKETFSVPIIGVLEGACKKAINLSKTKRIGVIGTSSTIKSKKYESVIKELEPDANVFSNPCPLFVHLVENGYIKGDVVKSVAKDYLLPIKKENVDTLILGCTHYPLLKDVIKDIMGDEVTLIDPGKEAAICAEEMLKAENKFSGNNEAGKKEFFVSDETDTFSSLASLFLGEDIGNRLSRVPIF